MRPFAMIPFLATTAVATTVDFFFPGGYEGTDPVASVVAANPTATTLYLACPTGTDSTECGFGSGFEYKIISTTVYEATLSEEGFIMTFSCDHNTKASTMGCVVSMGGDNANDPGVTTAVLTADEIAFLTATVTAGESLLAAAATGAASTQLSTALPTPSSKIIAASTGLKTTTSATASTTGLASGASGAEAAAATTNAAYKYSVEGSALLALVGVAAVNMW